MGHILKGQVRYTLAVEDVIQQGEIPTDLQGISPLTFASGVSASFNENIDAGSTVYTVAAEKPDGTTDGITYGISGTDAGDFAIDANTGVITIDASPNFEADPSYSIIVTANRANFSAITRNVALTVNNLDEVAPTITSGATATAIAENSGAGQVIYTVTVDDSGDISGGVTFTLSNSQSDSSLFSINSTTGAVTLTANPDFETKSSYTFAVVATDAAGNNTTPFNVTLAITDVFDTGLAANGTLGRFSPTSGLFFHGYEDSNSTTAPSQNNHRGSLSPTSSSLFYNNAAVREIGYGQSQYSSASGVEFKIAINGDQRSRSGFKLVVTDKNNVSRTFRTTDSNMYNESYNSFSGQTTYGWDVTDNDAQAVNIFSPFTGISTMSVGTKYTIVALPYPAHSSGSPGAGTNSASDRGQAILSIGGIASSNGYFSGTIVIANSNISNSTNITNAQDILFSNGVVADLERGDADGTGDSFSITLEEL